MIRQIRTLDIAAAFAATALLAAFSSGAAAQTGQPFPVPLSDPGRPAILEVSLVQGSVSVMGYDGDEILVATGEGPQRIGGERERERDFELGLRRDDDAASREGLRPIANTSMAFTVEERNNTVRVQNTSMRAGSLEISVPRRTSVRARATNNGSVNVTGVTGEHELGNVNGSIMATDIAGSVVANTANGDIRVTFTDVAADGAMSFTTFNGEIDVTFPGDLAADLRITTNRGEILTDFDVEIEPQAPTVERDDAGDQYRVSVSQDVVAAIGGGGPEIRFKSFNGDVLIRRR